jgi:hypothetical protein
MCDFVDMPDGTQIEEINDKCLCCYSQTEILTHVVSKLPEIKYDEQVIIERDCFGWYVRIEKMEKN